MKRVKLLLVAIVLIASYSLTAQMAITTDGSSADASAMLDVKSSDKGFLFPRMDSSQLASIAYPAFGLVVFNTTDSTVRFYNGKVWKQLALGIGADINRPWECGDTIVDARDSRIYTTVQIGNRGTRDKCWMAENLNYEIGNSWCYGNTSANCVTYGRLYDWETALGACPGGWHLPTDDEWKILEGTVDTQYPVGDPIWDNTGFRGYDAGKNLKSASGWNGTDLSGFGALPGGWRDHETFNGLGVYSRWLSSSEYSNPDLAWTRHLSDDDRSSRGYHYKTDGYYVRCIKDYSF